MKTKQFKDVVVVGLGYVGLPLLVNAAKSGYKVFGFDINLEKIAQLKLGNTTIPEIKKRDLLGLQKTGKINFTSTLPQLDQPSIFVIAVPTPLDRNRNPDLNMLTDACDLISEVIVENSLVVNESTSYIGTLRDLIKPRIDSASCVSNIMYAVAPERIDPGNLKWKLNNTTRVISGLDNATSKVTKKFYSKFCKKIYIASEPEVAEAAKLFENSFRQVNIALVNELSIISNRYGFSAHEVLNAASTKPFGFMSFYPSIGVGGHCIPVDPSYLAYSAELVGTDSKLIKLANQTNAEMPKNLAHRLSEYLDGSISGKKIQIAGIAYKPNVPDLRESPAIDLLNELKKLGAIVSWHDPLVNEYNGDFSSELNSNIDLGLIVTPHESINFSKWQGSKLKVLDLSANGKNYGWDKFL
jgi:UDP-N-acetyl-D-glucosamine dehydrogenase